MTPEQKKRVKKLLWDYSISEDEFMDILHGKTKPGGFNRKWAVRRAIEGLNYYDLIDIVGFKIIDEEWPGIRENFRIKSIREGMDYVLRKHAVSASG